MRARGAERTRTAVLVKTARLQGESDASVPSRVSLLPHRNDWTEIQHDAVKTLEYVVAHRGNWRRGDVERIPLTLFFIQHWLRWTGARRSRRDYARDVLATLVEMEILEDTGQVLPPRRQPRPSTHSYWYRVFEVLPITHLKAGALASLACVSLGSQPMI